METALWAVKSLLLPTSNTGISDFILALTSSIHCGKCSKLAAFVRSKTRIVPSDPL